MTDDIELMGKMRYCGHILYHRYPLNMAQNRILLILEEHGSMPQKEMMERMSIQAGSLSELIAKVEEDGFVTRTRSEKDRRSILLELTPSGLAQAQAFRERRRVLADRLFEILDEEEKDALSATLDRLIASWKEGDSEC